MSSYDEQRDIEAEGQRAAVFYSRRRERTLAPQHQRNWVPEHKVVQPVRPSGVDTSCNVEPTPLPWQRTIKALTAERDAYRNECIRLRAELAAAK